MRLKFGMLAGLSLAVSAALTAILLLVNLFAANLDRSAIRARVAGAYASGELHPVSQDLENRRGRHQFNDCLILIEVLDVRDTALRRALSPLTNYATADQGPCAYLQNVVLNLAPGEPAPPSNYHRYVHGNVALVTLLTSYFDIYQIRNRLSFVFAFTLLATITWLAVDLARTLNSRSEWVSGTDAIRQFRMIRRLQMIFIAILFMFCYSLSVFSMSMAHFWTDYLILIYTIFVFRAPVLMNSPLPSVAFHSAFGVLTAYFEFLHGGIPLGACMVLLAAGALTSDARQSPLLVGATAIASFLLGIVVIFGLKMAVTAYVFGPQVISNFTTTLAYRTVGESVSLAHVLDGLARNAGDVAGNWIWLGRLLLIGSGGLVILSVLRVLARKGSADPRRVALLVGAYLAVPVWYLVFREHTDDHPGFMTRTSMGMLASAGVLWALAYSRSLASNVQEAARLLNSDVT